MKIKHLILKLIFPLLFFQSLSSYPYHFKRLYRAKDDTTIDLISDYHAALNLKGCSLLDEMNSKYFAIFSKLKTSLNNDLKIVWESYEIKSPCVETVQFLAERQGSINRGISEEKLKRIFDMTRSYVDETLKYFKYLEPNGTFLCSVARFLVDHGIEVIDTACYRKKIFFTESLWDNDCIDKTYRYFICFWAFKLYGPEILKEISVLFEQYSKDSEYLEALGKSFNDYKKRGLSLLEKLDFKKFFDRNELSDPYDLQLGYLGLEFIDLSDYFTRQLVDYEILFNLLNSKAKRKILCAGGLHCNEIAKYLVSQCEFDEFIDLGYVFDTESRGEAIDFMYPNWDARNPTFKIDGDGVTRYFSFEKELDFEILQQALLEDPKLSYAKWIEAQKGGENFWQEVQERITKKRSREDSEEAQGREVKRPRAEEEQKGKRDWCVIS